MNIRVFQVSFIILLCIWAVIVSAQQPLVVQGNLTGVPDGTCITLFQQVGNVGNQVATDSVRHGHFRIQYPGTPAVTSYALGCYGSPGFPPMSLALFAKAGTRIHITGSNRLIKTWMVDNPLAEQKEYDRFIDYSRADWEHLQQIFVTKATLPDGIAKDSLEKLSDDIDHRIGLRNVHLLQQSPVSSAALVFLRDAALDVKSGENLDLRQALIDIYHRLPTLQKQSEMGEEAYSLLFPPAIVQNGEPAADAALHDRHGNLHYLKDHLGKYLLLDFWSSGCGPCYASLPELKTLSQKYSSLLNIVSITLDNRQAWLDTSPGDITWNDWSDGHARSGIAAHYGISGMPHYALISPKGILLDSWEGYEQKSLIAKIRQYISD